MKHPFDIIRSLQNHEDKETVMSIDDIRSTGLPVPARYRNRDGGQMVTVKGSELLQGVIIRVDANGYLDLEFDDTVDLDETHLEQYEVEVPVEVIEEPKEEAKAEAPADDSLAFDPPAEAKPKKKSKPKPKTKTKT